MKSAVIRALVSLGVGAATVAGGAYALRGSVPEAQAVVAPDSFGERFPVYPGARLFPIDDEAVVGGVGMRMAYFFTEANPRAVIEYYRGYWVGEHFQVDGGGDANQAHLTAMDPADNSVRSVTVLRQGGRNYVFCTVGLGARDTVADPIPLPEGAVVADRSSTQGGAVRSVTYLTRGAVPAQLAELRTRFEKAGWTERDRSERKQPKSGSMLEFARGADSAVAVVAEDAENHVLGVQLQQIAGEPGARR